MKRSRKLSLILIIFLLSLSCSQQAAKETLMPANPSVEQLNQLFHDDWESTLKEYPVFATTLGDRRYSDKLTPISVADSERRIEENRVFLSRLLRIDRAALPTADKLNYDIYKRLIEHGI